MSKLTPVKQNRAPKRPRSVSNAPARRSTRLFNFGSILDEQKVVEDMPSEADRMKELTSPTKENVEEQAREGEDLVEEDPEEKNEEMVVGKPRCSGEKYVCDQCGSEFERKSNYQRHKNDMHTEREGGWECKKHKLCFEKFSVKQEMLAHKAGCKFRCPKCDWSTGRSARVEGHLRVCK